MGILDSLSIILNGYGKKTFNDGEYEGDWKNGKQQGMGSYRFYNGNVYIGYWINGERTGIGKYIYKNGDVYEGEFLDGKITGKGVYKYRNGTIKEGIFENGVLIKDESNLVSNISNEFTNNTIHKFKLADYIPTENDFVTSNKIKSIKLTSKLAGGGEGNIYLTNTNYICKIFKKEKLNEQKYNKIKKIIDKNIDIEGLCLPEDIVYNSRNEFVGYLMKKGEGVELQKSVFIKQLLEQNFSNWKRIDLADLTITILEKVEKLHKNNIIIGDINPLNILVKNSKSVYFVDVDSYQIDDIPCPVGTVNFTAQEIQGKDYKTYLRSFGNEYFSVATLIFMIMLPGKAPYSKQGGGSPYENIKNGDFPYHYNNIDDDKIPRGAWKSMWLNMPEYLRKYFYESFNKGGKFYLEKDRLSVEKWINIMKLYKQDLENEMFDSKESYEIFPN